MPQLVEKSLIQQYLFGELSPAESEAFEERYFLDETVFIELQAAEVEMIDRYVTEKMAANERQIFETKYLVTSERRTRVLQAVIFHNELSQLRAAVPSANNEASISFFDRLIGGFNGLRLAASMAIVLLAVGTSWFAYDAWNTRQQLAAARNAGQTLLNETLEQKNKELQDRIADQRNDDAEALSALQNEIDQLHSELKGPDRRAPVENTPRSTVVATVTLSEVRGKLPVSTNVTIGSNVRVLNVQIPVMNLRGDAFEVKISREPDNRTITSSIGNKPSARRIITQSIPMHGIDGGTYRLIVRNAVGEESVFRFTIDRK